MCLRRESKVDDLIVPGRMFQNLTEDGKKFKLVLMCACPIIAGEIKVEIYVPTQ